MIWMELTMGVILRDLGSNKEPEHVEDQEVRS